MTPPLRYQNTRFHLHLTRRAGPLHPLHININININTNTNINIRHLLNLPSSTLI
jgi:hypothetical protein